MDFFPHILWASHFWNWNLLFCFGYFQGQFFSGSAYRIYLLGNPVIWWSNLVFLALFLLIFIATAVREQRGYSQPVDPADDGECMRKFLFIFFFLFVRFVRHAHSTRNDYMRFINIIILVIWLGDEKTARGKRKTPIFHWISKWTQTSKYARTNDETRTKWINADDKTRNLCCRVKINTLYSVQRKAAQSRRENISREIRTPGNTCTRKKLHTPTQTATTVVPTNKRESARVPTRSECSRFAPYFFPAGDGKTSFACTVLLSLP